MTVDERPDDLRAWRAMALAVLRKSGRAGPESTEADAERLLTTTTDDGIAIAPLHVSGPPAPELSARDGRDWDVRQHHDGSDPVALREAVAEDLAGGAGSIWLTGADAAALPEILATFPYDRAALVLDAGRHTEVAAAALFAVDAPAPRGNLGADPLGLSARTGSTPDLTAPAGLAARCAAGHSGRLRAMTVDATTYHEAGGGDAEELACALATAVAYLRALTGAGLSTRVAFDQIEFRYAVGPDQFLSMAKLRAARLLWARVAEVCGVPSARQRQHAVTSWAAMTVRAPLNNVARATSAAFAAVVAGADAVTVLPYDAALGRPSAEARRLARNTHAILRAEAHAARVHDPVAGSWYAERLTRDLAVPAWEWFQKIEVNGGMAASLADGMIGERLAATARRRREDLRHRRRTVVGVTASAELDEQGPAAGAGLPRRRYAEELGDLPGRLGAAR
jgi:methylmalonyl-CoA mutase